MVIVTLNPKVLYRGLFKGPLGLFVAKEREREREHRSTERNPIAWCVARAHREREREKEKEREDKESAAPFVEARYDAIKHFARFG